MTESFDSPLSFMVENFYIFLFESSPNLRLLKAELKYFLKIKVGFLHHLTLRYKRYAGSLTLRHKQYAESLILRYK
jgi:hypothetical protein